MQVRRRRAIAAAELEKQGVLSSSSYDSRSGRHGCEALHLWWLRWYSGRAIAFSTVPKRRPGAGQLNFAESYDPQANLLPHPAACA